MRSPIRKLYLVTIAGLCFQMIALALVSALRIDLQRHGLDFVEEFYSLGIRAFLLITPSNWQFLGTVALGMGALFFSFFLYALVAGLVAIGFDAVRRRPKDDHDRRRVRISTHRRRVHELEES